MSNKVKVAVIGYGHLGKWHCDKAAASVQANFIAIVEPFESNRLLAEKKFPNIKVVNDISQIINDIDAAIIATPTSTHFKLTKYLIENKKHVFCEKPLCDTYEEVLQLEKLIKTNQLVLQVGHSERFHGIWPKVKEHIKNLEANVHIRMNRIASFKGRAVDVDVVQDLMIHDLDLLNFLFDKEAVSITAFGKKIRTQKYDFAHTSIKYKDGTVAHVSASRNHVQEVRDLEIYSSEGCYYVDLMRNQIAFASKSGADGKYVVTEEYEKRDHLQIEQNFFYESIIDKKEPTVGFEDGKKAIFLIDKTLQSINLNKEIIIKS